MKKLKKVLKKYKKGKIDLHDAIAHIAIWFWQNQHTDGEEWGLESDWIPDDWENTYVTISSPFDPQEGEA